ncbi:serine/arginine repetitive matrix protein 2 [Drosophila guanche]|nr:serine/arginine repetitive matrix protein 2 [Drosophila guanche]
MVKSPWLREKNESQSPCQKENPMGLKERNQGSPSEGYFDITEQHVQRYIKTEPHDEQQSVDFERDPFDLLAELLEEENVPVYLVEMPLEAPPPPSISLPDDCFLFNRRANVGITSPMASSSVSISEHLAPEPPNQSETALDTMHEMRVQSKNRSLSRRSSCSQQIKKSRRRRSRSGSAKERQCTPTGPARRNRNERKGDRATCSRKGSSNNSSSMETKRCNKSRAKSKSTSMISSDTNRNRTRSPNRACSSDRVQFRKNMSYEMRCKFEENGNVFRRGRSRSSLSNRRNGHRHSLSPIRSPSRSRREFPRYIRRYSPKRMSRWRFLSREPTNSPSRSRSRQRCSRLRHRRHSRSRSRQHCRSREHATRHSCSRSRQHCRSCEPASRHSSSRSRRHYRSREPVTLHSSRRPRQQCSREPPKRPSRSRSPSAVNETRMTDTLSPVCSAMPNEYLQASGFIHPSLGQAAPMAHKSPRPILPIITCRFGNPGPPQRHLPQMPGSVASNQMWYTQEHYTHFEYSTTTMQDGTSWQAPVYNCAGATHSTLGPHDLRHRLGSTLSLPLGPHDLRHRIQGRTEYSSFPTEQEHMAPPYSTTTFGQTGYPSQYYTNGYLL